MLDLEYVKARWRTAFYLPGHSADLLSVYLATWAGNRVSREHPLWMMSIGPSSSGKTALLDPLDGLRGVLWLSTLTNESALMSHTPEKKRAKGATGGLLRELSDGDLLIVKDATSLLSLPADRRKVLWGALREIFDGKWTRASGVDGGRSAEETTWRGRVGFLGACTPVLDSHADDIAEMGQRFLLWRLPEVDRGGLTRFLMSKNRQSKRGAVDLTREFIEGIKLEAPVDENIYPLAANLGNMLSHLRSPVSRNRRHEINNIPTKESSPRSIHSMNQLRIGLDLIGESGRDRILRDVAVSSVPAIRARIIRFLLHKQRSATQIADGLNLARTYVRYALEDMQAVELLSRDSKSKRYRVVPTFEELWENCGF